MQTLVYTGRRKPLFLKDENNCLYIKSEENQSVSFRFAIEELKNDVPSQTFDAENIVFGTLSPETLKVLDSIKAQ